MNSRNKIGTYLGRGIFLDEFQSSTFAPKNKSLEGSLILIHFDQPWEINSQARLLIMNLIQIQPLAIVLAGQDAPNAFDWLVLELSKSPPAKHIMTKLIEKNAYSEILEDFVKATWPSEDRFFLWNEYFIFTESRTSCAGIEDVIAKEYRE